MTLRYMPMIAALLFCAPCVAGAAGQFDGRYVGRITNVKHATRCGQEDSWGGSFVVTADKFSTNVGGGKIPMAGDVHPDGSFETTAFMGRTDNVRFTGRIDGPALHATATSGLCEWSFEMTKQGS